MVRQGLRISIASKPCGPWSVAPRPLIKNSISRPTLEHWCRRGSNVKFFGVVSMSMPYGCVQLLASVAIGPYASASHPLCHRIIYWMRSAVLLLPHGRPAFPRIALRVWAPDTICVTYPCSLNRDSFVMESISILNNQPVRKSPSSPCLCFLQC